MKKIVISVISLVTLIAVSGVVLATTGTVNTDTARVRSEASSEGSIIDLLSINDKVEVLEESGDWYKIKSGDQTGYINKSLLDVEDTTNISTETKTTENTANPTDETTQEGTTTNDETTKKIKEAYVGNLLSEVTIKILPSINSTDIAKIEKDTQITVAEIINDWCHIEASTASGWARVDMVEAAISIAAESQEENADEATETDESTEAKVGYINAETVNFRKEASSSSEKIGSLTKNTKVTIIGEEEGWYKVQANGQTGYVSKQYISDKKVEEVTSRASDTARQIAESKEINYSSSGGNSDVVSLARQYLGYRYVSAGKSPSSGFDCSGFTSYIYGQFGVSLSGSSKGQANAGISVSQSELQPGDLLIFNNSSNTSVGHVGIYAGNGQMIHAANGSRGVTTDSISSSYYAERYVDARRVL